MEKIAISRHPQYYQAWPDVVLTSENKLITVFSQCTHHGNRDYTEIFLTDSADRGRTWSTPRALTESSTGVDYYHNCARINRLSDNRLVISLDLVRRQHGENDSERAKVVHYFSADNGQTWTNAVETPVRGIVPDRLVETDTGRWLQSAHYKVHDKLVQFLRYSDDKGASWSEEIVVAKDSRYNLCEAALYPLGKGVIVALLRENSMQGLDCMKTVSYDNGASWSTLVNFPLPGCHRPTIGKLSNGEFLVTYRFIQGGRGWLGRWTQNLFGAFTDLESLLTIRRDDAWARIFPIDFDRSPKSDLGYSGWVQFDNDEIYVVNYIVDDHIDKGQIRGYAFYPSEFLLEVPDKN